MCVEFIVKIEFRYFFWNIADVSPSVTIWNGCIFLCLSFIGPGNCGKGFDTADKEILARAVFFFCHGIIISLGSILGLQNDY